MTTKLIHGRYTPPMVQVVQLARQSARHSSDYARGVFSEQSLADAAANILDFNWGEFLMSMTLC